MRHVIPTTYGGHCRVSPTLTGEAIQLELFGSRGGFLAGITIDAAAAGALQRAIAAAEEEALELYDKNVEEWRATAWPSAMPELGNH